MIYAYHTGNRVSCFLSQFNRQFTTRQLLFCLNSMLSKVLNFNQIQLLFVQYTHKINRLGFIYLFHSLSIVRVVIKL